MYSIKAEKIIRLILEFNLWMSGVGIIAYYVEDYSSAVIGGVFFGWILFFINYYLTKEFHAILEDAILKDSPIDRCINIMNLTNKVKSTLGKRIWDYSLHSYSQYHGNHCKIVTCPLRVLVENKDTSKIDKNIILETIAQMINRHIKMMLATSQFDINRRIFAIGYTIENTKNYMFALELIKSSENVDKNSLESFILHCYWYFFNAILKRKLLKKKVNKAAKISGGQLELLNLIRKDKGQNKLCSVIEYNAIAREQFYDMLIDNDPSYEKFKMLGISIKKTTSQIKTLWRNLKKTNVKLSMKTLATYAEYYESILLDSNKAQKLRSHMFDDAIAIEGDILQQYAGSGDAVVSVLAKDTGVINKHNSVMCELTGYIKEELVGMPVERLIPNIIQEIHRTGYNETILLSINEQLSGFETRQTLLRKKSGYLIPVIMKIVAAPNYVNSQSFIVRFSKDTSCDAFNVVHILVDPTKNIVAISSSIFP